MDKFAGEEFTRGVFADTSFKNLIKKAENQSESVPEILRRTVYLYYLSRYQLSLHEASFTSTFGQVLNEYRNGLDHLMRFLSGGSEDISKDDQHGNLKKMEGHMQRALLDLCKNYTYKVADWADAFEKDSGGMRILALVDGGEFAREWADKRKSIHAAFMKAKVADSHLGANDSDNNDIVLLYLSVAHESYQLMQSGQENKGDIDIAGRNDFSLGKKGKKGKGGV